MGALTGDQPQFVELSGDDLAQAREDYRRIWGEDMPEPDAEGDAAAEGDTKD